MNTTPERFLGINVSKATLDAHLRPDAKARRFDNTPEDIAALLEWITPLAPTLIDLEATGGYERAALAALFHGEAEEQTFHPDRMSENRQVPIWR